MLTSRQMSPRSFKVSAPDLVVRAERRMWTALGLELRDARRSKKWSASELAKRAAVSRDLLYTLERGEPVSLEAVVRIAAALGRRAELHLVDPRRRDPQPSLSADPVHSLMGEFEARHFRPIVDGLGIDEPYQHYQFAGRADFVAWRLTPTAALLHIENRTRFPDFQEMAGSFNAKRSYLGAALAQRLGVRRWASETHVIAALWSAEVLHALRLRTESFRSLGGGSRQFGAWWNAAELKGGVSSELIVLDPVANRRQRPWIGLDEALSARPRHLGYADLARRVA